jgi:hypothetical protein
MAAVRLARLQVQWRLKANPSLKPELGQFVEDETGTGIEPAIADLEEHGEIDEVEANILRRAHYTEEQVLGDWFPEEPQVARNNHGEIRGDISRSRPYL